VLIIQENINLSLLSNRLEYFVVAKRSMTDAAAASADTSDVTSDELPSNRFELEVRQQKIIFINALNNI